VVRSTGSDIVYSPAGAVTPGVPVPQIAFAQNPWALVKLKRSPAGHVKAWLQRLAYRRAMRSAGVMVFNSRFMHDAYKANAGRDARSARIIYQGVDEETFAAAAARAGTTRKPHQIVSVSVMAPHKGVETLVSAIARLRSQYSLPATLLLIGDWPDSRYRQQIEQQVDRLGLSGAVTFSGHVTREALHEAYASSRVFSLMSWCESFGIPAVEAQAFGTPVVSSDCTAIPEVCGEGALFAPPGDDERTASSLAELLTNDRRWEELSTLAVANAERFRWDTCSRAYVDLFDSMARS
jgi:glycosyltransferase involved in cell wall biosynthesis